VKIRLDPDELTLGDAEDIEAAGFDLAGLGRLVETGKVPLKLAVLLVWITGRKVDPSFTYEDARALKVTELEIELVEVADSPKGGPTAVASLPSVSPPAGSRKRSAG
jgi:hypothetical protein